MLDKQFGGDYEEANRMLFEFITKPLHWNAYNYAMNNPLHFVDPTGKNEEISVHVNIVYDKNTIKTEEAAKELTAKIVADAKKTYKTADIKLVVTYTAGTANTNEASTDNGQKINSGQIDGAVNVYISNDNSMITAAKSNTDTGESFINYGLHPSTLQPRQPDEGILSHELGHQFGATSQKYGETKTEALIESTNNYLRNGVATENVVVPVSGRNSTHVPQRSPTRELPLIATYRNGARRFEIR